MSNDTSVCPRCNEQYLSRFPALCRRDNKTSICSDCGTAQALEDYSQHLKQNYSPTIRAALVEYEKERLST